METRLATIADAAILAELHGESFAEARWDERQLGDSLALDTSKAWIAEEDNEPQGFILCQFAAGEADILTICVRPAMRGRGMGKLLLNTVCETARATGIRRIFLEVAHDNATALALYEKAGFHITGVRPGYYQRNHRRVDAALLELVIVS